jgi:hypothetical protein
MVINPKPPTCIKEIITICPKSDQWVYVSYTIRPVTQVADVAVKSASTKGVDSPLLADTGSISKAVPTNIIKRKPSTMILVGVIEKRRFTKSPISVVVISALYTTFFSMPMNIV